MTEPTPALLDALRLLGAFLPPGALNVGLPPAKRRVMVDEELAADWKRRAAEIAADAERDRQRANRFHALAAMATVGAMPVRRESNAVPGASGRRPGEPTDAARRAARKAARKARKAQR